MQRVALLIEYDGARYAGWQRQHNGITIQQRVEEALTKTYGNTCIIHGAGRTDAGVHASGQVAHVQLPEQAHSIPLEKLPVALNTRLPFDVRIRAAAYVHDDFHARYSAIWREYIYTITTSDSVFDRHYAWDPEIPFSVNALQDALHVIKGEHDFTAISKHNPSTKSYVCNVEICSLSIDGSTLQIRIRANRFVYGMCRAIVGIAMSSARGRLSPDAIRELLATKQRQQAPIIVPAHGLNLHAIGYESEIFTQ